MVKRKAPAPKLERKDWIKTGLAVLAASGVDAIRVEPLAKRMKVTKGSFYWHFKDRQGLLDALLDEWVEIDTHGIIQRINQIEADPKTKLLRLFEMAIADDGGETPGLADGSLENAIRAWATKDPKVATLMTQVDQQRLDYTRDLFAQIGFPKDEALARARLAYYSLVGEFTVGLNRHPADRLDEIRRQHAILTANARESI